MLYSDLTTRLAYGELHNLAVADSATPGTIRAADAVKVLSHTNQGLKHLFSKFVLKEKEVILDLESTIGTYFLRAEYSLHNTTGITVPTKYIVDSPVDIFKEDIVKILHITDFAGEPVYINDHEQPYSVFTPTFDSIQVPTISSGDKLSIIYQAKHDDISEGTDEISIPFFLEEALQYYVASKIYSHMNGQEHAAKSIEYISKFNELCQDVLVKDLITINGSSTNTKLDIRGFA